MNYKKVYEQLIEKRRLYPLNKSDCYCEEHHIIPHCVNGSDDKSNLVNLTPREHYIAHVLLAKNYQTYNLYYAVVKMQVKSKNHQRYFRFNSRLYELLRKKCYEKQAKYFKRHPVKSWNKGRKNVYSKLTLKRMSESAKRRKRRAFSDEARKNMSLAHKGKPNGKKGIKLSASHIQKVREKNLGRLWFNNGHKEIKSYECPKGFVHGRLKRTT